jgi:rSAM/selenodomain-associated transferase 2
MKISIIIPVINEADRIRMAVERVSQLNADEVLFVDGGSVDGTCQQLQKAGMSLISSRAGRGQQLRAGAQAAQGDMLLFLHVDNWLCPDGVSQLRAAAKARPRCWGGFQQRIEDKAWKFRCLEWGNRMRASWFGLVYGDQAMFVCRELYELVGGMPAQPLMEDYEFSRRLNRILRPVLLPGPHMVSPRRWQQRGVLKQTLLNWSLVFRYSLGVPADRLNLSYRRHDRG